MVGGTYCGTAVLGRRNNVYILEVRLSDYSFISNAVQGNASGIAQVLTREEPMKVLYQVQQSMFKGVLCGTGKILVVFGMSGPAVSMLEMG